MGTFVPILLACLFGYHRPSEILVDKWEQYKLDQEATGAIKLDKKQIEFDVLGLMAQKDVKADIVKNHGCLHII